LIVIGFPVALVFDWVHRLTPEKGQLTHIATGKLDWALMGALIIVIALVSYEQFAPTQIAGTGEGRFRLLLAYSAATARSSLRSSTRSTVARSCPRLRTWPPAATTQYCP
jgi:hypothetical protein